MHNGDLQQVAYNILELAHSYNVILLARFNELLTEDSEMSRKLKVYCLSKIIDQLLTFQGSKKGVKLDKRKKNM